MKLVLNFGCTNSWLVIFQCVKELLSSGKCDVSLRNETGHCALMEAASIGKSVIFGLFILYYF